MNNLQGRIVVGVDGSDASIDALRWALRQAELTSCELEAVTSWQQPSGYGTSFVAADEDWEALVATILDDALAKVDTRGVEIKRTTAHGHPAQILTDASMNADLLVVGSRGHGGFVGMMLGSVSVHVCAHAHCPVLVIRHRDTGLSTSK
jgi:nucleotide-binding universal stress UspA family protein